MAKIITLTTDFGLTDEYVGVLKGVILTRTPEARIVDLSHLIERQNIGQAARLLLSAYRFFPAGTIHLVVVDPGVGSSRKLVLVLAADHLFLAPDNGVLGPILESAGCQAAYEVRCEQYYLRPVSATFHGRDILAPVAAELAAGLAPGAVGPVIAPRVLTKFTIAAAVLDRQQGKITGEIIGRDHFGNLQTNITAESLQELHGDRKNPVSIEVKNTVISGIQTAYAQKSEGELLALINSRGHLEIAVNRGSAAGYLGAAGGEKVTVAVK